MEWQFLFLFVSVEYISATYYVYPPVEANDTADHLYFTLIMSFGGAFNSSGTIPGIQVALDHINEDPNIIQGYKLHYILSDSQCNHTISLEAFFKQILNGPNKIALVGGGCSIATEPIADISHFYNITQISCASSSSKLADRTRYKAYFQLLPTEIDLAPAFMSICRQYGWKHITIIGQNENIFIITINELKELLKLENISFTLRTFDSNEGVHDQLFDENERIFFLAMYSKYAQTLLCKAWQNGMVHPLYTFLTYGWYSNEWWMPTNESDITCSIGEMKSILEYTLSVTQYPDTLNENAVTEPAGISFKNFRKSYEERLQELHYNYLANAEQCFDGIWALAIALNQTITELSANNTVNAMAKEAEMLDTDDFKIQNFTYKNNVIKQLMFSYLSDVDFVGVTGPVSFTSQGIRRVSRLRVLQYRKEGENLILVEVASILSPENGSAFVYLMNESDSTVWPEEIPYDGRPDNETVSVFLPVTIIYTTLSFCGLAFAVACLIFNLIYRKQKLIRLTSPKLNYLIITGAVMMYISAMVHVIPSYKEETETILCNLRPRLFSIGYSLCFGTILAKMWRVYYIFTNPTPKQKTVKDWHLGIMVLCIVLIDLIFIGPLGAFEGGWIHATLIEKREPPSSVEKGVLKYRTAYYTYICDSSTRDIWLGLLYGYKAVLQIVALFLAFGTRKVNIKGLNDSTYIAATIYITSVILSVTIIACITLNQYVNTFASLIATSILITATVILGLVFIPKMYGVYRDPEGENVFEQPGPSNGGGGIMSSSSVSIDPFLNDQENIQALLRKVAELENKINKETKTHKATKPEEITS